MSVRVDRLARALATATGMGVKESIHVLRMLFGDEGLLFNLLVNGNTVYLGSFGHFKTRVRKARLATNPQTGQPMTVPEKFVLKFYPSRRFKAKVHEAWVERQKAGPEETA